jgi:hypothetical protein
MRKSGATSCAAVVIAAGLSATTLAEAADTFRKLNDSEIRSKISGMEIVDVDDHWAARALLSRGLTGKVTMLDAKTGKLRTTIDIEKAAKLTVKEGPLRFAPYESMPERAPAAQDEVILVTMPPEANEAA